VGISVSIAIAGTLHQQSGFGVTGDVTYGARVEEDVVVDPPCDCAPEQLLPIVDWVTAHAASNDDALIGLAADALRNPPAAVRLDLPCGSYYLTGITGAKAIAIVAHGHTALFIDGDIQLSKPLTITLDPDATLDVLVSGDVGTSSALVIGSPNYPALSRFYIGGATGFSISSNAQLGSFFYAPYGLVGASSPLEVYGGVFAGDFQNSNRTAVHYDRAVLDVGGDCTPPSGCDSCRDCGNQACIDGSCGACTDSSQCCAPLVCHNGQCVVIVE
jgi:hypothetical protein